MSFFFRYRIWYDEEEAYMRSFQPVVRISEDDYKRILLGVHEGYEIADIPGIDEARERMQYAVIFADRTMNKDGTQREYPLQRSRHIHRIEYFLTDQDYHTLRKMKDPYTELSQPEDNMTIRRDNGSEIKITSIHGQVLVREGTRTTVWDKEKFLDCIIGMTDILE